MTIKDNIINELEINPNISYDEIIKRFSDIKKKHFSNTRWSWRKSKDQPKKGKKGKKGKVSSSSKDTDGGGMSKASPQISPILVAMNDNELARHRLRMILTNTDSTNKEVLEAVGRFVNYMDKSGTINIETQSEKEVMNQFRQQSTTKLVGILKESSLKEP